jgi:wobble nucleotide-excising tRNase
MLERIELVQGIGLLHDANGRRYRCQKATLIFADNGRGKSTLASVLRAASTGDVGRVNAAKTLDGTLPPKVVLQFGSGHRVSFDQNAWSEKRPELVVFDATFVEQNVHSGGSVSTTHRKNLLDFALGTSAVQTRTELERATRESATAGELIASYTSQLTGYHAGFTLRDFEALPAVENIDIAIADIRRRITDATNVDTILAKPVPAAVTEPQLDLAQLFSELGTSLANVHADAERVVQQHVAHLEKEGAESWLSEGNTFSDGSSCPYCRQNISTSDLVQAYQTYFNASYNELKDRVATLSETFTACVSDDLISAVDSAVALAIANAGGWTEHVTTDTITFDKAAAAQSLQSLRTVVLELLRQKVDRPAEATGTPEQERQCQQLWDSVLDTIRAANVTIEQAAATIEGFKSSLSGESLPDLNAKLHKLEGTKRRYEPAVTALFENLEAARTEQRRADTAKQDARTRLNTLMETTLSTYQTAINAILVRFGAGFRIEGLGGNFRGNAPRSEYGLLLRGKTVPLEGGPPSFATALSEGDKRTLAFAFFIASTAADPQLGTRIVVIDDPMCSLDLNRKTHTLRLIKNIYKSALQLIVLAHDPYFLKDVERGIEKQDNTAVISKFRLAAVQNDYTSFADLDLTKECESKYVQNHRLLNEFDSGQSCDARKVAEAIRPMLEGYLHRRFPGYVSDGLLFGQMVGMISTATATSPLRHAQNLVDELNEINEYAGQFHHDTDVGDSVIVTPAELKPYVQRALAVVHTGAPMA